MLSGSQKRKLEIAARSTPVDIISDKGVSVVGDLDELAGPDDHVVLPLSVDWTPHAGKPYDLAIDAEAAKCYQLLLAEGTVKIIKELANKNVLKRIWPDVRKIIPSDHINAWESSFPGELQRIS